MFSLLSETYRSDLAVCDVLIYFIARYVQNYNVHS